MGSIPPTLSRLSLGMEATNLLLAISRACSNSGSNLEVGEEEAEAELVTEVSTEAGRGRSEGESDLWERAEGGEDTQAFAQRDWEPKASKLRAENFMIVFGKMKIVGRRKMNTSDALMGRSSLRSARRANEEVVPELWPSLLRMWWFLLLVHVCAVVFLSSFCLRGLRRKLRSRRCTWSPIRHPQISIVMVYRAKL